MDFLKQIIKETGNEFASIVDEGVEAGDVASFIDTGSYIFNGLISGSIKGGLPANKITAIINIIIFFISGCFFRIKSTNLWPKEPVPPVIKIVLFSIAH